jgi:hypothetical protein
VTNSLWVGNQRGSGLPFLSARFAYFYLLDKYLDDLSIAAIAANPWQLFEPEGEDIWVPPTRRDLSISSPTQRNTFGTAAIFQLQLLRATTSAQKNAAGSSTIIQLKWLAAAPAAQKNTIGSAVMTQLKRLQVTSSIQRQAAETALIGQNHPLAGIASILKSNASVAAISQVHLLEAVPSIQIRSDKSHPYYFFHGYAGNQFIGDSLFFDLAAGNHGVRGGNLSDSEMFGTAGMVTTKAPSNPYDTCIRLPNLNYDYSIGEKLFVWWLGKITPAANERAFIGDGFGTSTTGKGQRGIQIRCNQSGKLATAVWGATGRAGVLSNAIPFDGGVHDIAFVLDGANRTYGYWIDGKMDSTFAGSMLPFYQSENFDTKNSNTFNLGSSFPAPGTATAPQSGIATQTRAFVIIRLPASYSSPSAPAITNVCKALRANPGKLLLGSAL